MTGSQPLPILLGWRDRGRVGPDFTAVPPSCLSLIHSSLIPMGFESRNGRFLLQGSGRGQSPRGGANGQAQWPLHVPKVLVRSGGEGCHLYSPHFTDEQTEALGLDKRQPREAPGRMDLPQWGHRRQKNQPHSPSENVAMTVPTWRLSVSREQPHGSFLPVLRARGLEELSFCCKKIPPGQQTAKPQTSQDPTMYFNT